MDPVRRVSLSVKINPNNLPVELQSSLLSIPHDMMDVHLSPEREITFKMSMILYENNREYPYHKE